MVQVHYHPIGRRVRDRSRIGLHFARGPVRQHLTELLVANMNLRIRAGAEGYVHRASYTLPVDVTTMDRARLPFHELRTQAGEEARRPRWSVLAGEGSCTTFVTRSAE